MTIFLNSFLDDSFWPSKVLLVGRLSQEMTHLVVELENSKNKKTAQIGLRLVVAGGVLPLLNPAVYSSFCIPQNIFRGPIFTELLSTDILSFLSQNGVIDANIV